MTKVDYRVIGSFFYKVFSINDVSKIMNLYEKKEMWPLLHTTYKYQFHMDYRSKYKK